MQFTLFAEFVLSIEGSKLCLKMLLFSLVTHMSCQLDVIGCTEESPIFDGMYSYLLNLNPKLKERTLIIREVG